MDPNERKGWLEIIGADDLDSHMAEIGQAEVNADIVKQMFEDYPLAVGSRLVVPGCGTCQMFDYMAPSDLRAGIELTLTDINPDYLAKAQERLLRRFPGTRYDVRVDDIEETRLEGKYGGILITLVLQHVNWRKALDSMMGLRPDKLYIIIQEQDATKYAVTKKKELADAWKRYAEIANPKLVPRAELIDYLVKNGYGSLGHHKRDVPDNKTMAGFVFEKEDS